MERDFEKIVQKIGNLIERWHLGRDNDDETLKKINDVLYENGYLSFFNDKKPDNSDNYADYPKAHKKLLRPSDCIGCQREQTKFCKELCKNPFKIIEITHIF